MYNTCIVNPFDSFRDLSKNSYNPLLLEASGAVGFIYFFNQLKIRPLLQRLLTNVATLPLHQYSVIIHVV